MRQYPWHRERYPSGGSAEAPDTPTGPGRPRRQAPRTESYPVPDLPSSGGSSFLSGRPDPPVSDIRPRPPAPPYIYTGPAWASAVVSVPADRRETQTGCPVPYQSPPAPGDRPPHGQRRSQRSPRPANWLSDAAPRRQSEALRLPKAPRWDSPRRASPDSPAAPENSSARLPWIAVAAASASAPAAVLFLKK